jgi:hypothetical protein
MGHRIFKTTAREIFYILCCYSSSVNVRALVKSPEFIFGLMGVVALLTVISFFVPSQDFISTYTGLAYILIFVASALVVIDSKTQPSPGMTLLLMLALFVVLTCHLLANAFVVQDQLHEYVAFDFSITIESVILFNIIIILIYALVIILGEAWIAHKRTRIYLTIFTLLLVLSVTFIPWQMASSTKEDRAVTVGGTYATLVDNLLFDGNYSLDDDNATWDRWEEDFWANETEVINRTNDWLNSTGFDDILKKLDERYIGIIMELDQLAGSPTLELTLHIDLLNGTIEDIEEGTDDIYIPLELVPSGGGSGMVASYVSATVDEIAMEEMGGWGLAKDGIYDVVFYADYYDFRSFIHDLKQAMADETLDVDETKKLAEEILDENKITIAPISELYDIDDSASSSSKIQQTFARAYQE